MEFLRKIGVKLGLIEEKEAEESEVDTEVGGETEQSFEASGEQEDSGI